MDQGKKQRGFLSHTPKRQPENEFMSTFSLRCIKSRPREAVTISGQSNPDFRNSILSYVREIFLFFINTNKQIKQPLCLKLLLKLRWSSTKHSNPSACWVIYCLLLRGEGAVVKEKFFPSAPPFWLKPQWKLGGDSGLNNSIPLIFAGLQIKEAGSSGGLLRSKVSQLLLLKNIHYQALI